MILFALENVIVPLLAKMRLRAASAIKDSPIHFGYLELTKKSKATTKMIIDGIERYFFILFTLSEL